MWHIELVKNKYESLEDLYSLLQYVFNITVENSVFECENNLAGSSYMIKTDTYAINGPGFCLSDTSREKGTISNCTFVRVSNCIREMGVVQNCVFENCSNVVNNCGYMVRENLFNGCKQACVDLQKKAIVSNCQFANCKGHKAILLKFQ